MRGYGFPEKNAWDYSLKEWDAPRELPARRWLKRYTHKCARQHAKKLLGREAKSEQ